MKYHIHLYNAKDNISYHKTHKTFDDLIADVLSHKDFFPKNEDNKRVHKLKIHAHNNTLSAMIGFIQNPKRITQSQINNYTKVLQNLRIQ